MGAHCEQTFLAYLYLAVNLLDYALMFSEKSIGE